MAATSSPGGDHLIRRLRANRISDHLARSPAVAQRQTVNPQSPEATSWSDGDHLIRSPTAVQQQTLAAACSSDGVNLIRRPPDSRMATIWRAAVRRLSDRQSVPGTYQMVGWRPSDLKPYGGPATNPGSHQLVGRRPSDSAAATQTDDHLARSPAVAQRPPVNPRQTPAGRMTTI